MEENAAHVCRTCLAKSEQKQACQGKLRSQGIQVWTHPVFSMFSLSLGLINSNVPDTVYSLAYKGQETGLLDCSSSQLDPNGRLVIYPRILAKHRGKEMSENKDI